MRDVAGNLGRPADAVEITVIGAVHNVGGAIKSLNIEDRNRLFEGLHRGAEHLLDDAGRTVVGRNLAI